ncbi:hypothetical protein ACGFZU_37985 [Streptomyces tendae]|uniref:hypothetical protein n=1 Tax=Streptomyces tendae TaxID=1932 RepID=UPI00371F5249
MTYSIARAFDDWVEFDRLWASTAQRFGDESFYMSAVREYGRPAVELGIGYGRMAAHTRPDIGIDVSADSLACCPATVKASVHLLHEDFRSYRLEDPAALSYAPLGSFNHIIDSDTRVQCFANVRANTRPGGFLLFDSYVVSEQQMRAINQVVVNLAHNAQVSLHKTEKILDFEQWISENHGYADFLKDDGTVHQRKYYQGPRRIYIPPHQFAIELGRAGWHVENLWGGFERKPLRESSTKQVWLAANR